MMKLFEAETTVSGKVTDIFAHQFVVTTDKNKILADLGPEGAKQISLKEGDQVEVSGEMKPSELKVARIVRAGDEPVTIKGSARPGLDDKLDKDVDVSRAFAILKNRDLAPVSRLLRKPRRFEVLAEDTDRKLFEVHLSLNGTIKDMKVVDADDRDEAIKRLG